MKSYVLKVASLPYWSNSSLESGPLNSHQTFPPVSSIVASSCNVVTHLSVSRLLSSKLSEKVENAVLVKPDELDEDELEDEDELDELPLEDELDELLDELLEDELPDELLEELELDELEEELELVAVVTVRILGYCASVRE